MKKLLVVVDYQNDFVCGSLGFSGAQEIETSICEKIEQYHNEGSDVLFTFDTHFENYPSTREGQKLPVAHCIDQSYGWQLYGNVSNLRLKSDYTISKHCFGSIDLANFLLKNKYDRIEFVGVVTDICVISNAVIAKAALPEAEIIIDASCVASNNEEAGKKALDVMAGLQMTIINA